MNKKLENTLRSILSRTDIIITSSDRVKESKSRTECITTYRIQDAKTKKVIFRLQNVDGCPSVRFGSDGYTYQEVTVNGKKYDVSPELKNEVVKRYDEYEAKKERRETDKEIAPAIAYLSQFTQNAR